MTTVTRLNSSFADWARTPQNAGSERDGGARGATLCGVPEPVPLRPPELRGLVRDVRATLKSTRSAMLSTLPAVLTTVPRECKRVRLDAA